MPQPETGQGQPAGNGLWTFDANGNLVLAGVLTQYGQPQPGGSVAAPLWPPPNPDLLTFGETVMDRAVAGAGPGLVSGTLQLSYFTAAKAGTTSTVQTFTSGTAAAGLTTAQVGLYVSDRLGNLTLAAASVANVAGLWQSTFANFTTPLVTPFTRAAGQRLALAVLAAGTTAPALQGINLQYLSVPPVRAMALAGQASLPATIAATALAATNLAVQGVLTL